MSVQHLNDLLGPRVERGSRVLRLEVWGFLLVQATTLVLTGANLAGYRANPVMLGTQLGILVLALAFAAFGVWLHGETRRLERVDRPLVEVVRRRLAFYGERARTWSWVAAFSFVALAFAINTWIDNVDGRYPINKPVVFFGTQVAMVVFLVLSFHVAHEPRVRELRAVLSDLEHQLLDRTPAVDRERGRRRAARVVLVVVLAALAALGLWMALR